MGLQSQFAQHFLWNFVRLSFILVRNFIWLITGKYTLINESYKESSYNKTIQVLNIWARHKLDYVLQPSGADNFITVHSHFEDPEYALRDTVSLYYVNKTEAVFVETDPGFHVTDSDRGSFVRIAQFKNAKRLLIVPMHIFHQLGEKVGKTDAKIIFLYNTSRCGSTLLTQVFEETEKSIAYSEPDALNAVTQLVDKVSEEELDRIIMHTINILCKPLKGRNIECYILKPTSPTITGMPKFEKLVPDCYNFFMYRNGLETAKSLARAANGMPLLKLLFYLGRTSPTMTKKMVLEMGLPTEYFEKKVLSPIHFCSIVWAGSVSKYLHFLEKGHKVAAIRYEDMKDDPQFSFKNIFEYVGMEYDSGAVERAFGRDSQRESPLSMKNLKNFSYDECNDEVISQTDKVCDSFGFPHFDQLYILPGTITHKE